jgi:uncharacterized Zn ribbon protein
MWREGDQYRRLHPDLSRLDSPCKFGIYSLKLKAQLLDALSRQQNAKTKSSSKQAETETDSSNGLVSRLDKVRITSEVDDNCRSNGVFLLSVRCVSVPVRVSVAPTVVVHLARDANLVEPADQPVGTVRLSFRLFRRRLRLGVLLPGERVQQLGLELEAVDAELARRIEPRQIWMKASVLVALSPHLTLLVLKPLLLVADDRTGSTDAQPTDHLQGGPTPVLHHVATDERSSSNGLVSRLDKVRITSEVDDTCRSNGNTDGNGNTTDGEEKHNSAPAIPEKTIVVQDKPSTQRNSETAENAKNSGSSSKVLTQGDKLNLIKDRKFQQASKSNLADGQGENLESNIQGLESTNMTKTKSKTSTEGKTSKLNSLRTSKPNILPKREGSRTNSRSTSSHRPTSPATRSSSKSSRTRTGAVR